MENKTLEYNINWSLKKLRLVNEYHQRDIADKLELSISGYSKKEKNGKKLFSAYELKVLSDMFKIPMEDMYKIISNN